MVQPIEPVAWLAVSDLRRLDIELDRIAGPGHPASSLKPGVFSPNQTAVAGRDGYLFISNGANRWERQYDGELVVDPAWVSRWIDVFARRQAEAGTRGVALWNMVAPEKQVLYPEMRGAQVSDGTRRPMRQLLAAVEPGAQLYYPEPEMRAAKAAAPVYSRHNSHWTGSGCWAATEGLLQRMLAGPGAGDPQLAIVRGAVQHDLSVHFFDPPPFEDSAQLVPAGEVYFDNKGLERTGRNEGASYGVRNPSAAHSSRVIVFGDSYACACGLTAALTAIFSEVVFMWSKSVIWELVDRHQSQVVIWESAERFLATLPQA